MIPLPTIDELYPDEPTYQEMSAPYRAEYGRALWDARQQYGTEMAAAFSLYQQEYMTFDEPVTSYENKKGQIVYTHESDEAHSRWVINRAAPARDAYFRRAHAAKDKLNEAERVALAEFHRKTFAGYESPRRTMHLAHLPNRTWVGTVWGIGVIRRFEGWGSGGCYEVFLLNGGLTRITETHFKATILPKPCHFYIRLGNKCKYRETRGSRNYKSRIARLGRPVGI